MTDRIELRGLRIMATHGVLDFEKFLAQPFEVDLDIEMNLRAAGSSDRLEDTVSYGDIVLKVEQVVKGENHALIERIAQRICDELLDHSHILAVEVTVRKLRPPLPVDLGSAAVRIRRP